MIGELVVPFNAFLVFGILPLCLDLHRGDFSSSLAGVRREKSVGDQSGKQKEFSIFLTNLILLLLLMLGS